MYYNVNTVMGFESDLKLPGGRKRSIRRVTSVSSCNESA